MIYNWLIPHLVFIPVQVGRISEDGLSLLNRKTAPTPVLTNGINTKMDIEALLAREASRRGLKLADLKADIEEKSLSLSDLELFPSIPAKTLSIEAPQRKVLYNGDIENGGVKLSTGRSHGKANGDSKKSNSKARNDIEEDENSDSGDSTASSGVMRSSTSSSPKSVSYQLLEAYLIMPYFGCRLPNNRWNLLLYLLFIRVFVDEKMYTVWSDRQEGLFLEHKIK